MVRSLVICGGGVMFMSSRFSGGGFVENCCPHLIFELDVLVQVEFVGDVVEVAFGFCLGCEMFGLVLFVQKFLVEGVVVGIVFGIEVVVWIVVLVLCVVDVGFGFKYLDFLV